MFLPTHWAFHVAATSRDNDHFQELQLTNPPPPLKAFILAQSCVGRLYTFTLIQMQLLQRGPFVSSGMFMSRTRICQANIGTARQFTAPSVGETPALISIYSVHTYTALWTLLDSVVLLFWFFTFLLSATYFFIPMIIPCAVCRQIKNLISWKILQRIWELL